LSFHPPGENGRIVPRPWFFRIRIGFSRVFSRIFAAKNRST
jgi:hypothetical protein